MSLTPYEFEFFATEIEYEKLQLAYPNEFPNTYEKFAAAINQRIEKRMEQVSTKKAYAKAEEFASFCATKRGGVANAESQLIFAQYAGNNQIPK